MSPPDYFPFRNIIIATGFLKVDETGMASMNEIEFVAF